MEKIIRIDGKDVAISNSCGALVIYRQQFGREYFEDLKDAKNAKGRKKIELCEAAGFKLLWAMARTADDTIPPPQKWLGEIKEINVRKALSTAEQMISESMKTKGASGKGGGRPYRSEDLLSACISCGIGIDSALKMPLGFLLDVLSEYADSRTHKDKDVEIAATQADYDAF